MSEQQWPRYEPDATPDVYDNDQPSGTPPKRRRNQVRHLWPSPMVTAILVVTALAACILISLWPKFVPNVPSPERTIPVATATPTANILTRIDRTYGPWEIVNSGVDAPGKILLIDATGAMKAGVELSVDDTWQTSTTPIIADKTLNLSKGTVTFRLGESVTVTVLANQAFILKQTPELIYSYRDGGNLVARPIGA